MEKAILLSILMGLAFVGGYAAGEESAALHFSKGHANAGQAAAR